MILPFRCHSNCCFNNHIDCFCSCSCCFCCYCFFTFVDNVNNLDVLVILFLLPWLLFLWSLLLLLLFHAVIVAVVVVVCKVDKYFNSVFDIKRTYVSLVCVHSRTRWVLIIYLMIYAAVVEAVGCNWVGWVIRSKVLFRRLQ